MTGFLSILKEWKRSRQHSNGEIVSKPSRNIRHTEVAGVNENQNIHKIWQIDSYNDHLDDHIYD